MIFHRSINPTLDAEKIVRKPCRHRPMGWRHVLLLRRVNPLCPASVPSSIAIEMANYARASHSLGGPEPRRRATSGQEFVRSNWAVIIL